ncbi:MAG: LLM class flavin-dependent oxidoreductase [Thaumarchaeota archaeon]|nr:LLM class flavin-dependent oxidoreductase [Nitrososphaerota archaeon]
MKRLRFGVNLLPYGVTYTRLLDAVLRAEQLGFESVWLSDHMQRANLDVFECWTAIAALAAETKRIRIGTSVTCASFRNPALLAKMGATVDHVSGGRLELGLGAGYDETEFSAYGIPFPSLQVRIKILEESIQVIKTLWTARTSASFDGEIFKVSNVLCQPKPVQKPHPPIWVAGRSSRVLDVAARLATGVNMVPYSGVMEKRKLSTIDELAGKISELQSKCETYKRNPSEVDRLLYSGDGGIIIADDEEALSKKIKYFAELSDANPDELKARLSELSVLHGRPDQIASRIQQAASAGFNYILLQFYGWQQGVFDQMEDFARRVVTRLQR